MRTLAKALIAAAIAAAALPALAQDADPIATLQVDRGTVMAAEGGEYVTAATGTALVEGQRLMVTEGSKATVVYDNDCRRTYAVPGVYVVEDRDHCKAAVLAADSSVSGNTVAKVVAVGLVLAPIIADVTSSDDDGRTPVSR